MPKKNNAPRRQPVYYILDQHQLQCMASPVRQDMVDHLSAHGVMSIKELAASIGKKPSSIYHHLKLLLEADLIVETGSRVVNRKLEKLYATPSRRMRMSKALEDPENNEELREIVGALCRQTDRDFSRGLENEQAKRGGQFQNLRFFRLVNRPTPQSLRQINKKLDEIAEILWSDPDPNSPLVALTWILAPKDTDEAE
ncbi:winged helix-turn-helix domain-containing protein [Hyphococcus sp.]|uniref:winged helix-turn-helix domain-containing protein n=1 Tax=Hyphococcus sp. TaxID=2038636 RepID=UPI0035C70517